jgi:hypothetical protein
MSEPASNNLPVFFLLDETTPATIHPLISEACRRLDRQGLVGRLLSIPCPDQPAHPLLADTGPYTAWLLPSLPPHRAVVATSALTALAALCSASSAVFWLLDRHPYDEFSGFELEQSLARRILDMEAVTILAAGYAVAGLLPHACRERVVIWPLLPPLSDRENVALRSGMVVDHMARTSEGVVLAAEAFAAGGCRPRLLTNLLGPPYPEVPGLVRIRPFDRDGYYRGADLILKLDAFHANLPLLVRMLGSGAVLATSREALGSLPGRHGETVWCFSSPRDPLCIRREAEYLMASDELRTALRTRGMELARQLVSEALTAAWTPTPRPNSAAADLLPVVRDVLRSPFSASWNRTLARILQLWYDSASQKPR